MALSVRSLRPEHELSQRAEKLQSILDVAKLLTAERDLDSLLALILRQAKRVVDADRCSLFLLDRDQNELWSKIAQGTTSEIRLPIGSGIAGAVAETGIAINLPDAYQDDRFNRSFDDTSGYTTRSVLCVPMRNAQGEITGVLQALNNKRSGTFTDEDAELLMALGGQAAGAIENALLNQEISRLFEGFVSASVVAIEARDPLTAGHSGRVATLTVALARATEQLSAGPYAGTRFSEAEIQEIRYASLLHDFGKVGVREPVLVKAEKLYPHELELLRARFELARKDRQLQSYKRRLAQLQQHGAQALEEISQGEDRVLNSALAELDELFAFIIACNRPAVLEERGFERLSALQQMFFEDSRGGRHPLLRPSELDSLSIGKGSLSEEEREEIESHVEHTFRFLSQIPWTRRLRRIPEIAYAHHEKLNGQGYPRGLTAEEIPLPSKMMTICDIYDALTSKDRPYKRAIPHPHALDILHAEVRLGRIDAELLRVFVQAQIPTQLNRSGAPEVS